MEVDVENDEFENEEEVMKSNILNCVAKSEGFFKSQQVGEKDLTVSEKRDIASSLLEQSIHLFLQRYWRYIKVEDISYFETSQDYEVNFYLSEIRKLNDSRTNNTRIKNRRYGALKQMIKDGTYFSDGEMKKRNPFQFDQFIGQHLTEKERIDAYKKQYKDEKFSSFLMNQFEKNVENCLYNVQKEEEEALEEEVEDESENESEESELEDEGPSKQVSENEKERLRSEFTNIMYESFISGNDKEFDYNSVDENADYDPNEEDLDAEEKYFDSDS